ncbi:MAG: hypothetical protein WA871_05825 [Candidatus Acidiferrales bacterium]
MPKKAKSQPCARTPRTQRELAQEVFKRHNPVDMACELLKSDGTKGASIKVRVWEKLIEFGFGKTRTESVTPVDIPVVWDIPGPDPDPESDD